MGTVLQERSLSGHLYRVCTGYRVPATPSPARAHRTIGSRFERDKNTYTATHLVKIKLDGDLRIMEIPAPPRFGGLVKAVMEAYAVPSGREKELTFTYRDNDGDEVRIEQRFPPPSETDWLVRGVACRCVLVCT